MFGGVNVYCFSLSFLIYFLIYFFFVGGWDFVFIEYFSWGGSVFLLDEVSWYLVYLTVLLLVCILPLSVGFDWSILILVLLSGLFSIFCFISLNVVFFWLFYEASILIILFLIYIDSPYSERYLAGWYLIGYVVFSGLPVIGCFMYIGLISGSFNIFDWSFEFVDYGFFIIILFMFSAKVPLFPFHTWLPIVHAEASTIVSMCLSGFIMKLGVIGIYRVIMFLYSDLFIGMLYYVYGVFFCCIMCFFSSVIELDGKRWLAFLSVAHIGVVPLCILLGSFGSFSIGSIFSFGHGVSSNYLFLLLWFFLIIGGSRNLLYIGWSFNSVWFYTLVSCGGFLFVSSFPPVVNFFVEAWLVSEYVKFNYLICFLCVVYLFFSSLVPIIMFGSSFIRRFMIDFPILLNYRFFVSFILFFFGSLSLVF
uniref:NADH-ubiquinone oxidoreductase chain 4 n=1 Tax=Diplorchis hangzhouensis TaxID=1131906 RepID=A0A3G0WS79_9PLAT|nr:NADH dehydrogenase subunit 4 [Diplorchis hangzhouensis]